MGNNGDEERRGRCGALTVTRTPVTPFIPLTTTTTSGQLQGAPGARPVVFSLFDLEDFLSHRGQSRRGDGLHQSRREEHDVVLGIGVGIGTDTWTRDRIPATHFNCLSKFPDCSSQVRAQLPRETRHVLTHELRGPVRAIGAQGGPFDWTTTCPLARVQSASARGNSATHDTGCPATSTRRARSGIEQRNQWNQWNQRNRQWDEWKRACCGRVGLLRGVPYDDDVLSGLDHVVAH